MDFAIDANRNLKPLGFHAVNVEAVGRCGYVSVVAHIIRTGEVKPEEAEAKVNELRIKLLEKVKAKINDSNEIENVKAILVPNIIAEQATSGNTLTEEQAQVLAQNLSKEQVLEMYTEKIFASAVQVGDLEIAILQELTGKEISVIYSHSPQVRMQDQTNTIHLYYDSEYKHFMPAIPNDSPI